ncbi:MAG: endopeptidase La [Anaerolineales bacterium]|nr:endopeptidase La [Anaerolineales bacterium]MCX7753892.1 endopeptidase La [Anaerolineales bacterium]MDW8276846.1 endopeptidase La [Anaerolineales bacterium]
MPASRWQTHSAELFNWMDENDIELLDMLIPSLFMQFPPKLENGTSPAAENVSESETPAPPDIVPILPLRGVVVFPQTAVPLTIGQPRSIKLVDDVVAGDRLVGLVAAINPELETPGPGDLYTVGTIATVHRLLRAPDGTIRLLVQGLERIRIVEFTQTEPYLMARIERHPETVETGLEIDALARNARDQFAAIAELIPSFPRELVASIAAIEDPLQTVYAIVNFQRIELAEAQQILELDSTTEKLRKLVAFLVRETEVLQLGQKIQNEARSEIDKVQREYFLREQLKAIQKELGEKDEQAVEIEEFRRKIEAAKMPEEADKMARRELQRMERLPTAAAEYGVIRTYLDWLVSLPWSVGTEDNLDIAHARQVLEQDHYGLEDIKERILEFLAIRKLKLERRAEQTESQDRIRREREGVILCFVGPPGVGKTSLGQSIARAMGRKFIRISLGGVRDEAEIRGHRRTYIGAMPGRILQALRRVESRNPVFMLDEVDKLVSDFHGDPSSALLEVLDPEQNNEFRDNYLEVAFDLSQVMFIATANTLETIPGPLRDRMEIIGLSGYTEGEKVAIARGYLIPRQVRENGLKPAEVTFTDEALYTIIRQYTREAGVRNLERTIGTICRKIGTRIAEGKGVAYEVTPELVREFLKHPPLQGPEELSVRTSVPGVVPGLAWTPYGGDVLFIEATRMPGAKGFQITGSVGNVMQESARAALSYVRSHAAELGIEPSFYDKTDLHLHIPAGAQPKDGPSAGVTMATALVSLLTGRLVKPGVGMTGEITLRGQVLPIGGVKEKVLAAHRNGLKTVILPKRNEPDLEDVPEEIKQAMQFVFVENVDEVIAAALEPAAPKTETPLQAEPSQAADLDEGKSRKRRKKNPETP